METVTYTNRLGESVTFGGPLFYLQEITGLGEVPSMVQTQKVPYENGSTLIDVLLEERPLSLTFVIANDIGDYSYGNISEKREFLTRVMNPLLGPATLRYENERIVREIQVVPESVPLFPDNGNRTKTLQKGSVGFTAPKPFWTDVNPVNVKLEDYTGNFRFPFRAPGIRFAIRGDIRTLVNEGDNLAPIFVRFVGNAVNPIIKNETTGEFIKVNRTIPEGFELHVSTENGNKFVDLVDSKGVKTDVFNFIDVNSSFFKLVQGENIISFITDGGKPDVYIEFKNDYLGV